MAESLWQIAARSVGRPAVFESPQAMWDAALAYFKWAEDNPLMEAKAFSFQGSSWVESLPKMRAFTLDGFWLHSGMSKSSWYDYKEKDVFSEVITRIETSIREQKFTGAAADLLNPNIIARDLGLKDTTSNEHTGANGGPIQSVQLSKEDFEAMKKRVIDEADI